MRILIRFSLTILTLVFINSCIPPSTDQIKKIDSPDYAKTKDFGIDIAGQTTYQFYQKYGFTDLEEQLILIIKPNNVDFLTTDLPIDSINIKRLGKIDMRKFIKGQPVIFEPEKTIQSDIRLESKEYDSGKDKLVFHDKGKYGFAKTDTTETIFVFNSKTGLLYIESKKNSR